MHTGVLWKQENPAYFLCGVVIIAHSE